MPKITVIIPVYNSEMYLENCLKSVVSQTLKDIEIICVNDCSKDNSWNIVKKFADNDERFVLIENSENKKQGYCRNIGINKAKSDYIHFLDSDDWLADNNFYQTVYEELSHNDIDIFVFNDYEYHEDKNILVEDEKLKRFPFIYNSFDINNNSDVITSDIKLTGMAWDKIYKRDFLIKNNIIFAEGMFWEDILFNFLLKISSPKIKIKDEKYIVYRLNAKSSTTTNVVKIYKDAVKMMKFSKNLLDDKGLYEEYKFKFIEHYFGALYYDILVRVKRASFIKFLFMKNDIKNYFIALNLSQNDMEKLKVYNEYLYQTLLHLKKGSIFTDLLKYFISLIFSVKNSFDKRFKVVTILGIKFKLRRENA